MPWHDMNLDRRVTAEEVRSTISEIYRVQSEQVELVISQEYPDYSKLKSGLRVLVWLSEQPGDFPLRIEITPWEEELMSLVTRETEERICEILNCRALVATADSNPYIWMLIADRVHSRRVKVDPNMLDAERSGFVILSYLDD
jgi:hypothetical protein